VALVGWGVAGGWATGRVPRPCFMSSRRRHVGASFDERDFEERHGFAGAAPNVAPPHERH